MGAFQRSTPLTPAIGLETEFANNVISWSVADEVDVAKYVVVYMVAGVKGEVEVMANNIGTYSVELPDGAAEIKLTIIDTSGYTQKFNINNSGVVSVTIDLTAGWNLLSVPFAEADLKELSGGFWTWEGDSYVTSMAPESLQGFWYYSDKQKRIEISGIPQEEKVLTLNSGWNLIGPAKNIIAPSGTVTYTWGDKVYDQLAHDSDVLVMGHGYWIFSETEKSLAW